MNDGHKVKNWARTVVVLAAALLAMTLFRAPAAGLDLAISEEALSLKLKGGIFTIAFDIGQECPDSNIVRRFV